MLSLAWNGHVILPTWNGNITLKYNFSDVEMELLVQNYVQTY